MKETAKSDKVVFLHELARKITPSPFALLEVVGHASVPIIKVNIFFKNINSAVFARAACLQPSNFAFAPLRPARSL